MLALGLACCLVRWLCVACVAGSQGAAAAGPRAPSILPPRPLDALVDDGVAAARLLAGLGRRVQGVGERVLDADRVDLSARAPAAEARLAQRSWRRRGRRVRLAGVVDVAPGH